jgi:uncharacterized protein (TIGR02246 family)
MTTTDIDATVAEIEARYEHAYSAANASELARLFAEDAMVQTEWGPVLDGRERMVQGLVALFRSPGGPGALRNVPVLSRRAAANVIVSHGIASRTPTGGTEETFLSTRVYVQRDGTWLLLANQIARPSNHPRPLGIGR